MTARIFVADGQATNRITLKVRLAAACYQVVTAGTAAQLMTDLRKVRPHLIILGAGLPDANPVALCAELARGRHGRVPVVILAPEESRLAGLQAGAAAVLDPGIEEQMLLARIRGLLRDTQTMAETGLAEAPAGFDHPSDQGAQVALVADSAGRALCWKHLLGQRLPYRFVVKDPEEALGEAATGHCSDLYLIAADIEGRGDGLRLLSELRSRKGSRDSAFVIATEAGHVDISAIALDLGAGDVLPVNLGAAGTEAAALALRAQMSRKLRGDQRRAEAERNIRLAMIDPLTGLYNRRYALPRLAEIAVDADRSGTRFAALIMDLDYFKQINDRHGHGAGDAVLAEIARRLEHAVGQDGLVARLGGEEFLAVLPDSDESLACAMAERIRNMVEARPVLLPDLSGGGSIGVTLSAGVALISPRNRARGCGDTVDHVLERADKALIMAKNRGRNRVMLAQPDHVA